MATKTQTRLFGPKALENSTTTQYTVPGSTITVLRHLRVINTTGGAVTFTASIGNDAAATRLFDAHSVAANSEYDWHGYVVMAAAEVLKMHASAATSLTAEASGDQWA